MLRMAQNPEDQMEQSYSMAPPVQDYAQMAAPVNPHATLTAPISAAPPEAPTTMAENNPVASPLARQKEHLSSRLMADYDKDADKPTGFGGKLLHGLDVAAGAIAPRITGHIPGTQLYRQNEEAGLEKGLQNIAKEESEIGLQGAQAGHATAEGKKTEAEIPEIAPDAAAKRNLEGAETEHQQVETKKANADLTQGPTLLRSFDYAVNKALKEKRDPDTDPVVQGLHQQIISLQPGQNKEEGPAKTETYIPPGGKKPMTFQWNPQTGKYDIPLGEHYERPINVNVGREERQEKGGLLKLYAPAMDSAERFNVMAKNYEDAVKNHDQQAMLSLLANHLGMTMGLQKGARMTRDIIREAEQSRPWLKGMEAKFDSDGYLTGVNLTLGQMKQMVNLGRERYSEDYSKAKSEAAYMGDTGEGPERRPNSSTINHYIALANGDVNKAKDLAKQDGWSVK